MHRSFLCHNDRFLLTLFINFLRIFDISKSRAKKHGRVVEVLPGR